jgi:hypothetical protein
MKKMMKMLLLLMILHLNMAMDMVLKKQTDDYS